MQLIKIPICESLSEAYMVAYLSEDAGRLRGAARDALIICPGGGYNGVSEREGEPVAKRFLAAGFQVFELHYSVKEGASDFRPLREAALAVAHVREHGEEYHVDPHRIFILGFSAGGHLAASVGVMWDHEALAPYLVGKPEGLCRPDGMVLCYPVITAGKYAHRGSIERLVGHKAPTPEECAPYSLELHVNERTCPTFLWHTANDGSVPVENSLLFVSALREAGISFELHIYPDGPHGLSLANSETSMGRPNMESAAVAGWVELAVRWMRSL